MAFDLAIRTLSPYLEGVLFLVRIRPNLFVLGTKSTSDDNAQMAFFSLKVSGYDYLRYTILVRGIALLIVFQGIPHLLMSLMVGEFLIMSPGLWCHIELPPPLDSAVRSESPAVETADVHTAKIVPRSISSASSSPSRLSSRRSRRIEHGEKISHKP